jgi:hypothetical protein
MPIQEALSAVERAGDHSMRIEAMTTMIYRYLLSGATMDLRTTADEILRMARPINLKQKLKPAMHFALRVSGLAHFFNTEYGHAEESISQALASQLSCVMDSQ